MSTYPIYAQKEIIGESELISLFGTDDASFTYNGVAVMGSGLTGLAAIGAVPNANGATLTASVLNLQPASASFGGVLTTGAQTIAGAKTFAGNIIAQALIALPLTSSSTVGTITKNGSPFLSTPATNIFLGTDAGSFDAGMTDNVCIGHQAGNALTSGADNNTGLGQGSLASLADGVSNTCLGQNAGSAYTTNESYNCCIANTGVIGDNTQIRIGNNLHTICTITGIHGVTSAGATAVVINSDGKLGTVVSTKKRKRDIEDIPKEDYERLFQIQPKKFKMIDDESNEVHYGAIAEEVDEIMPECVVHDKEGNPASIQYHKLTGHFIAILQEHQKRFYQLEAKINSLL